MIYKCPTCNEQYDYPKQSPVCPHVVFYGTGQYQQPWQHVEKLSDWEQKQIAYQHEMQLLNRGPSESREKLERFFSRMPRQ